MSAPYQFPLPLKNYSSFVSSFFVSYIRSPDHPSKIRLIRILQNLLGRKRLIAPTIHGFRMALDDADYVQRCILHTGDWEPEISTLLWNEITPEDVFYDMGANIGFYLCLALQRGAKRAVAFDPDPTNGPLLISNLGLNHFSDDLYNFQPVALSNKPGTSSFKTAPHGNMGIGTLTASHDPDLLQVPVTTIDRFLTETSEQPPTVMKIDVEGWEDKVLQGSLKTIQDHRPKLIVVEADCGSKGEILSHDLIELFQNCRYHLTPIGPHDTKGNYVARPL
ncbi:MAG: methyltransferase [Verrucomicrobiaceae bacterium]|nr:methyltransferase [Verrucomicrobiaceae bacterium]